MHPAWSPELENDQLSWEVPAQGPLLLSPKLHTGHRDMENLIAELVNKNLGKGVNTSAFLVVSPTKRPVSLSGEPTIV